MMSLNVHARPAERDEAERWLRVALDDPAARFRDGQWQIIDKLVNERARVLAVQPTGWGKSMVYFLATRLLRERGFGTTIIVSPLLALMREGLPPIWLTPDLSDLTDDRCGLGQRSSG